MDNTKETALLRIAVALERLAPREASEPDLEGAHAFVWDSKLEHLRPVKNFNRVPLDLLCGINTVRDILLNNTFRFAEGLPSNNALLWGARGMGKSSLVKAVHAKVATKCRKPPALVEVHREDINALPQLLVKLESNARRWIVYCDDLSLDYGDSYRSLKGVLEGGLEGRPENVVFYATTNRRHIVAREAIDNKHSDSLMPGEEVDEKISLSDRFGLWLGFHPATQEEYFEMVASYAAHYDLKVDRAQLLHDAAKWSVTRGARSGRVAWQFIQDLAGRLGKQLG